MKKYEFIDEEMSFYGKTLHRIKATRDFGKVKAGDLGGFIEHEGNLDHEGSCWVYNNARVFDEAHVWGNARIFNNVVVRGNARISSNAQISDNVWVSGDSQVHGTARVMGSARISDNALVYGYANVCDNANIYGYAVISGRAHIGGNVKICDRTHIRKHAAILNISDFLYFKGLGYTDTGITAYKCKGGDIQITFGAFSGTVDEFRELVKNAKYIKEYLAVIELIKVHFGV